MSTKRQRTASNTSRSPATAVCMGLCVCLLLDETALKSQKTEMILIQTIFNEITFPTGWG